MSKGGRRRDLARSLDSHIRIIEETFQILDAAAPPTLDKVDWSSQVAKHGDEVSKQATIEIKDGTEGNLYAFSVGLYFNILKKAFLMLYCMKIKIIQLKLRPPFEYFPMLKFDVQCTTATTADYGVLL